MTEPTRSSWFALTNAHGLRLAIQSGRLGCPPRSASAPRDASSLFGGLPVLTHGRIPSGIAGIEGPTVALHVLASATSGAVQIEGTTAFYAPAPIHMRNVRAAHFESSLARDEFLAGLRVLDPDAMVPGGRAVRVERVDQWSALPSIETATERGRAWSKQLAAQERVSAAFVLMTSVSQVGSPLESILQRVRIGDFSGAPAGLRDLATALSRLDEINGWTGEQLASSLESIPNPEVPGLASFVRETLAAQDPFGDAIAPSPVGAAQVALSALLPCAGLATPESATYVIDSIQRNDAPEAAAMAGFAFTRTLLPRRLRPRELDERLVDDELRAAKRRVQSASKLPAERRPRRRQTPSGEDSPTLGL